jgi:hypothetical protein
MGDMKVTFFPHEAREECIERMGVAVGVDEERWLEEAMSSEKAMMGKERRAGELREDERPRFALEWSPLNGAEVEADISPADFTCHSNVSVLHRRRIKLDHAHVREIRRFRLKSDHIPPGFATFASEAPPIRDLPQERSALLCCRLGVDGRQDAVADDRARYKRTSNG